MKYADDTRTRVPPKSEFRENVEAVLIVVIFWGFYAFDCATEGLGGLLRRP